MIPITKAEAEHHQRAGGHMFEAKEGEVIESSAPRPVAPEFAAPVAETQASGGPAKK